MIVPMSRREVWTLASLVQNPILVARNVPRMESECENDASVMKGVKGEEVEEGTRMVVVVVGNAKWLDEDEDA